MPAVRLLAELVSRLDGEARRAAARTLMRTPQGAVWLARMPACPVDLLTELAGHPSTEVRLAVAENLLLPGPARWTLCADKVAKVARAAADANPHVAAAGPHALDLPPYTRASAAALAAQLADHDDPALALAAVAVPDYAADPDIAQAVARTLGRDWSAYLPVVLGSLTAAETLVLGTADGLGEFADVLLEETEVDDYARIAERVSAHAALLDAHLPTHAAVMAAVSGDNPYARQMVAAWPAVDSAVLRILLRDDDTDVQRQAMLNPRASAQDILDAAARDTSLLPMLARVPGLAEQIPELAAAGDPAVLTAAVGGWIDVPVDADMVRRAAASPDSAVRSLAAQHDLLPVDVQVALAADEDWGISDMITSRADLVAESVIAAAHAHGIPWGGLHLLDDEQLLALPWDAAAEDFSDHGPQFGRIAGLITARLQAVADQRPESLEVLASLSDEFEGTVAEMLAAIAHL